MSAVQNSDDILDSMFKQLSPAQDVDSKGNKAPSVIGKALFEDDLLMIGSLGCKGFAQLFGQKMDDKKDNAALPINFGSKSAMRGLPDDVRLRLFQLKKMIHNVEIQAAVKFAGQHVTPDMMKETPLYKYGLAPMLKAYNITDFSNWIPTVNARFYFEEFEIPFLLANEFDQLPMDSATVDVPGDIGHLEGHEETDAATFTAQSTTQDSYQVISRNNVTHAQITQDLLSDSAPAYIEKLRRDVSAGAGRAYERCIINGDITGSPRGASHQDSDTQALALNATFAKAFNGLRKKAFANSANATIYDHGGDSASKLLFETLLKKLGKFADDKSDLTYLVSSSVDNAIVTGAIPELFTAFAVGGIASNITGKTPPIFGASVLKSNFVREDLNASGVYQSGQALTSVILFNKSRFSNFVRQALRIWASPSLPSSDIMLMTAKMRHAWAGNNQSATEKSVVMAINVAP